MVRPFPGGGSEIVACASPQRWARWVTSVAGALQRDQVPQRRGERRGVDRRQLVLHQQGAGRVGAEFEDALIVVRTVGMRSPAVGAEPAETLGGAAADQRPDAAT